MGINPFRRQVPSSDNQLPPNLTNAGPQPISIPAAVHNPTTPLSTASNAINDTTPLSYNGFPAAPPSYGVIPTPTYNGFPAPGSYGAFPSATAGQLDPPVQTAINTASYGGFPSDPVPPTTSYGGFPDPTTTYGAFPAHGAQLDPPLQTAMSTTSYSGFPDPGTTYGAFPAHGAQLDPPVQTTMNQQGADPSNDMMGGSSVPASGTAPPTTTQDLSTFNAPSAATAEAKSQDMMATAPVLPPTSDTSSFLPPHAMTAADSKIEAEVPAIPAGDVGNVAAGTPPPSTNTVSSYDVGGTLVTNTSASPAPASAAPAENVVTGYDVGGNIVNPPITLPPTTPSDTPPTGVASLNPTGVADSTTSSVHTPGAQL